MTGIVRRQVYSAVDQNHPFGFIVVHDKPGAFPVQVKLSIDELEELRAMIGETLEELRHRQKA